MGGRDGQNAIVMVLSAFWACRSDKIGRLFAGISHD
jgi:hypothetical protein